MIRSYRAAASGLAQPWVLSPDGCGYRALLLAQAAAAGRTIRIAAELHVYASTLQSLTHGRGRYVRRFASYEAVPPDERVFGGDGGNRQAVRRAWSRTEGCYSRYRCRAAHEDIRAPGRDAPPTA